MAIDRNIIKGILRKIPAFENFSDPQIDHLANMQIYKWEEGEAIMEEGSGDSPMVVLLTGRGLVEKKVAGGGHGYERLTEIDAPAIIGENAFFTRLPRAVTVKAEGRVMGLQIGREDFFGLGNLEKKTMIDFLRKMGLENLKRVDQQVDRFISTITMMGGQLRKNDLEYFDQVITYRTELADEGMDLKTMAEVVKEIFVLLRNVNESLEQLFNYANLEDLQIQRFEPEFFAVERTHPFYKPLRTLANQITEMQSFLPLEQIRIKNMLTGILLEQYRSNRMETRSNYANFLKSLNDVYDHLQKNPKTLGLVLKPVASAAVQTGQ